MIRRACARSCSTHHARSSNAAASNSKFFNGFVKREPLLTLLRLKDAALHGFRLQKVSRFPFGFNVAPQRDRHNHGSRLAALIGDILDLRFRGGGWPCESLGLPASNGARFGEADNFTPMARSGFRRDPRGVRGLMERGFSDEDILKILGGDTLRVMRDVGEISRQLKTEAAGGGRK